MNDLLLCDVFHFAGGDKSMNNNMSSCGINKLFTASKIISSQKSSFLLLSRAILNTHFFNDILHFTHFYFLCYNYRKTIYTLN